MSSEKHLEEPVHQKENQQQPTSSVQDDDEIVEYEVEYEDEEYEEEDVLPATVKVDPQNQVQFEEIEEYEVEDEDDEEEEEEEEFDRVASKIDELINKANTLQQKNSTQPPTQTKKIEEEYEEEIEVYDEEEDYDPRNLAALKHVKNKWNISELNDDESMGKPMDSDESDGESSHPVPAGASFGDCLEPPFPRSQLFSTNLDEEDEELEEIEIALEDPGVMEQVIEEEEEEEDDDDQVDDQMPDNLLLDDQIDPFQIELAPMTPSPTTSTPTSPGGTKRPISPSSLILNRVRNLVITGQLVPLEELLQSVPNFFIDAILKAGWTALMYASYKGYPDIVDFCLRKRADPNYHKECFTSLMAVCSSINEDEGQLLLCMRLLLENGARVNAEDKFGCRPLHYAARFGRARLAQCLCQNGAGVNHTNRNGWTALHYASAENAGQVVATLLQENIDVTLCTKNGYTAAQMAQLNNHPEIAEALKEIEQEENEIIAAKASLVLVDKINEPEAMAKIERPKDLPLNSHSKNVEIAYYILDGVMQGVREELVQRFHQSASSSTATEIDNNAADDDIVPKFRDYAQVTDLSKKYSIDLSNMALPTPDNQQDDAWRKLLIHLAITCFLYLLYKFLF